MKLIKNIFIYATFLVFFSSVYAQDNLTVVLKGGTELTGFISNQRPGENFTFSTSKAVVVLQDSSVKLISDNEVQESSLSQQWKSWADEHDAYESKDNNKVLILSDIITDKGAISQVRILEKGAKLRYLEMSPNSYSLSWDTISVVKAEKRSKLLLSGINRRYRLSSGIEYEGQYFEEVPGKTLSLLKDDGVVEVFNTQDVIKDSRIKVNPNQSLIEQSDLLDLIQTKDNSTYRGVIFERNYFYDVDSTKEFLLIQLDNNRIESVNLSDISEYRKEKNQNYKPVYDIVLPEESVAINRKIVKMIKTKEISGIVTVNADSLSITIPSDSAQTIIAEAKFDNIQAQQFKLIKVNKYQDKNKKNKASYYYGFTYEDIVKNSLTPESIETSVNGISKMKFSLPQDSKGTYGVFDPVSNSVVLFKINNKSL